MIPNVDEKFSWAERVEFRGETYRYNDAYRHILLLGIDDPNPIIVRETGFGLGDQSDFVLLASINERTGELSLLSVNRDTMTTIKILSYDHQTIVGRRKMQLTLAHAYGDGADLSARLMADAVSTIFGGMPLNAYVSINYGAVPLLNDAVGGVTVTLDQKMTIGGKEYDKGRRLTLKGDMATDYVRARMRVGSGTNLERMNRQKLYISAYLDQAQRKLRKNSSFINTLLDTVGDYMVSSLGTKEMVYLANLALSTEWGEDIYTVPGELILAEKYYEYYVNDPLFSAMLVDRYYICESDVTYRELEYGDSGADVLAMKKRLDELGYTVKNVNSQFRSDMIAVINEFQRNNNLHATGVATPLTQRVLFSDAAKGA